MSEIAKTEQSDSRAFEDKVLDLYEAWLADDEGLDRRGMTKREAQRALLFAVDLATYAKAIMTGDLEAAED